MSEGQCTKKVYPRERYGAFHGYQCQRKEWKDGFCKQHHPDTVAEREKAAQERWTTKCSAENKQWRLARAAPVMLEALKGVENMLCGEYPGHPMTIAVIKAIDKAEGTE